MIVTARFQHNGSAASISMEQERSLHLIQRQTCPARTQEKPHRVFVDRAEWRRLWVVPVEVVPAASVDHPLAHRHATRGVIHEARAIGLEDKPAGAGRVGLDFVALL